MRTNHNASGKPSLEGCVGLRYPLRWVLQATYPWVCGILTDASKEFEAGKKQNVLTDENIEKIVAAYGERKDIPGFAKVVSMEEIEENGYNLNVPRYVNDADEEKEPMTVEEVMKKLGELKADETAAEEKIVGVMKELGVA